MIHAVALPNWLETASRNHPDKLALEFGPERWTFSKLCRQVDAAAETVAASFPEQRGRIGILSANRPGFVLAVHAAVRLGIPFVPLNWRLTPADLAWQTEDSGITLLIADETLGNGVQLTLPAETTILPIAELEHASPQIHVLNSTTETEEPRVIEAGFGAVPGEKAPLPSQWERGWGEGRPQSPVLPSPNSTGKASGARIKLNHEAAIVYTSGASGRPKGAILTYGNLWFAAVASALHLGHHPDDVWLATMPLFHVGGLAILFRGVIGATPVMLHDRFDPIRALDAIDDGATLVSLVPAMLDRMIEARGDRPWPTHLRLVLLGGSAAPPRLLEDCLRLGIPVAPTYGLTEATSQVTTLLPDRVAARIGGSGQPLPLTELRIRTENGDASASEIGEIEIRGPTLFAGYLGESEPRDPAAWFATGDVGHLDNDGFLYVVDRRDDLIVSGGENIYPAEIERVLRIHPLVADAGVVGVSHETWGTRPVAAVVWTGDSATAEPELRAHCAQELASYKIPDRFILTPELPRTATGKLLRRVLSERLTSGQYPGAANDPD